MIWVMGEYGQAIPDAPYDLEPMLAGFDEEPSAAVRLELLTAATKLFFKRPGEMQARKGLNPLPISRI